MRLQKVISHFKPEVKQLGKFKVTFINHRNALRELRHYGTDAIVVDDEKVLKAVLSDDRLYLKPLFYEGHSQRQCDGTYNSENPYGILQKIEKLNEKIEGFNGLALPENSDKRLLVKILRYLLTRNESLDPLNSRLSGIGYCYPLVEDMSIEKDHIYILKNLEQFAAEEFFRKKVIDKVNVCYECHGSYLNFSECCTKCNSLDLRSEELIHHFRCAYIGPQSDFIKDEKLICPKCDQQLKHIGIDYDKPSEIHRCQTCNHSSQETKMKAKCVDCSKENELEQLVTYEINQFVPTEKGRELAGRSDEPIGFTHRKTDSDNPFMDMVSINLIKAHEARRQHMEDYSSYEMDLSINKKIISQLSKPMQRALLEELSMIIKPYLGSNDLMSLDDHNNIRMLLIDYKRAIIEEIKETLQYNLDKMLRDNGWCEGAAIFISYQTVGE